MKLKWIGLSFLVVSLLLINASLRADQSKDILRLSLDASSHIDFEGIKETIFYTSTKTYRLKARVIYQKPGFIYIEYIEPSQMKGKIIIDNGKQRIEYISNQNKINTLPSFNCPQIEKIRQKALEIMLNNFQISQLYEEKVLGRRVYVLSLNPKHSIGPLLKLWIDKETYLPLKKEKYGLEGNPLFLLHYVEIKFNKSFPKKVFYDKIPKIPLNKEKIPTLFYSRQEIEQKVDFPLSLPGYLPPGYIFQGGEIIGEGKTVKLVYTNGLEIIAFFQRPYTDILMRKNQWMRWDNLKIRFQESMHGKVFTWSRGKKTFVLIGELPFEEFIKIIRSIK